MSDHGLAPPDGPPSGGPDLEKAQEYVEAEGGRTNRLSGGMGLFITAVAVIMSLFHMYAAYSIVPTQTLRPVHVAFVLFLTYLLFPIAKRYRDRIMWWDWIAAMIPVFIVAYMIYGGDDFTDRNTSPNNWDLALGVVLIVLVMEAMRRTSGWIMPAIATCFILYALFGENLPAGWAHRSYELDRLVGHLYMTLEGIFGVAVDVSSSLIILFTIYGAFLEFSGAGTFFIDFSLAAMGGSRTGAGRTVVFASFLLGGPSGSGVATTVTLGSVAYPMLAKAGYSKEAAGGLLAAGGLGAVISPPVLGAAAFLIAEFLKISYLDVLLMAVIPTCLYYLALFLMVELDARKFGMRPVAAEQVKSLWYLSTRYGFHFISLIAIVVFMLIGYSPVLSVFWATVVTFLISFARRDCALLSYDLLGGRRPFWPQIRDSGLLKALENGSTGVLNVAATCAGAGIIVGVVTLTGLGLKFSELIIGYAHGSLFFTALYTSLIVWIVGLAVPITASYIISAVIAAPALIKLGVPDFAAHMFIFYYAVLSEVSPPTALSPFAAAAITGGDPYKTTLQSWKYTMPAFLVPFMFVLDPAGQGLLLMGTVKALAKADWGSIAIITLTAMLGIGALAAGLQRWLIKRATWFEAIVLVAAGLALTYPGTASDAVGIVLLAIVIAIQLVRKTPVPGAQPQG